LTHHVKYNIDTSCYFKDNFFCVEAFVLEEEDNFIAVFTKINVANKRPGNRGTCLFSNFKMATRSASSTNAN
jgi:hypothetical protein